MPVLVLTKTGVLLILVIFQLRQVQPHEWKALAKTFRMIYLNIALLKNNQNTYYPVSHAKQVSISHNGCFVFTERLKVEHEKKEVQSLKFEV